MIITCKECSKQFEGRSNAKYCVECRPLVLRRMRHKWDAKYAATDRGKAAKRRYKRTTKGKLSKQRYDQSPKGRLAAVRKTIKYQHTGAGRLIKLYQDMARRSGLQDPEAYVIRHRLMRKLRERCVECGAVYRRTHQLDHIIPLALGRLFGLSDLDTDSNWQILCLQCHKEKTRCDISYIAELKREIKCLMN